MGLQHFQGPTILEARNVPEKPILDGIAAMVGEAEPLRTYTFRNP